MIKCSIDHPQFRLSTHVEKLGFPSFNLPALLSCPYKTIACEAYCYALKGRFKYKPVQAMYLDNFLASKCDCFVEAMSWEIRRLRTLTIRIHASGDFYSKKYFDKWVQISKENPKTVFYAYTRNWTLDLNNLPMNMIMYYSIDHTTVKINETAQRYAKVIDMDKTNLIHLETYKDGRICNSDDCASCQYCFETGGNVYFPQKYKKYRVELITV